MRALPIVTSLVLVLLSGATGAGCSAQVSQMEPGAAGGCAASGIEPGEHQRSVAVGDDERRYILYLPKGYSPGEPVPVVLNFHGGAGHPDAQVELTGMNRTADRHGFAVVYPAGSGVLARRILTFNAGSCCGYARDKAVDDLAYVEALLDDLAGVVCIDRARIYATGHSNGGMMAHRLGCQLSEQIAAVASVAGPIGLTGCHPSRPMPVLHIHGTADRCAPYEGGAGASRRAGKFRSVEDTRRIWLSADDCSGEPEVSYSEGNATCRRWSECAGGAEVVLCTIEGGGHAWPGAASYPSERICGGKLSDDLDANEMIWSFFSRHALSRTTPIEPDRPAERQPDRRPPSERPRKPPLPE